MIFDISCLALIPARAYLRDHWEWWGWGIRGLSLGLTYTRLRSWDLSYYIHKMNPNHLKARDKWHLQILSFSFIKSQEFFYVPITLCLGRAPLFFIYMPTCFRLVASYFWSGLCPECAVCCCSPSASSLCECCATYPPQNRAPVCCCSVERQVPIFPPPLSSTPVCFPSTPNVLLWSQDLDQQSQCKGASWFLSLNVCWNLFPWAWLDPSVLTLCPQLPHLLVTTRALTTLLIVFVPLFLLQRGRH